MADAVNVNHDFVTNKADSADETLVSADEWNEELIFSQGADGQPVLKDSTKVTGAKYGQAFLAQRTTDTYAGASPSGAMASNAAVLTDVCYVIFAVNAQVVLSTGNTYTATIRRDGSTLRTRTARATGEFFCIAVDAHAESAGTHTYDVVISVGGGATFTSSAIEILLFTIPRT